MMHQTFEAFDVRNFAPKRAQWDPERDAARYTQPPRRTWYTRHLAWGHVESNFWGYKAGIIMFPDLEESLACEKRMRRIGRPRNEAGSQTALTDHLFEWFNEREKP